MVETAGRKLKLLAEARRGVLLPGASNALAARVVEDLGYEALYVTGAGVSNTWLGMPDLGFTGLSDVAAHVSVIREAVELPIVVDADTGFGNAVNMYHSVRLLERAGANAVQIEDQVSPKRCGHFTGKAVVSADEMVQKVKAAVDARSGDDFLIIARTDARAVNGFEDALDRCRAYAEAGADITFLEAPTSVEELSAIPRGISVPQVVNLVVGGRTPILSTAEFATMGFGFVLYANVALQAAIRGMREALGALKEGRDVGEDSGLLATFEERQRTVRKDFYDELDVRYASR